MNYVKVDNGVAVEYSIQQLKLDNPNTSFPTAIKEETLASYNVYPVSDLPAPAFNTTNQKLVQNSPENINGAWVRSWSVVDLTEAEKTSVRQTMSVSMRQARLALHQQGYLQQVEDALALIPEPDKTNVSIEWEYSSVVDRTSEWVSTLQPALGLTDDQMDALFVLASEL